MLCCVNVVLMSCHVVMQRVKKLPPNWKYESATASALVS
jgi:hypothetical protein